MFVFQEITSTQQCIKVIGLFMHMAFDRTCVADVFKLTGMETSVYMASGCVSMVWFHSSS